MYILAGWTESYGAGKHDVWLIKADEKGIELWNRTFGEIDDDEANSIQQTSDCGYILAGHTRMGLAMPGLSRQMLTVAGYGAER